MGDGQRIHVTSKVHAGGDGRSRSQLGHTASHGNETGHLPVVGCLRNVAGIALRSTLGTCAQVPGEP